MTGRLAAKTAIVTGASRGIGLAIARRLVDEGAKVVITARKQDSLDAAVEQLGGPDVAIGVAGRADDIEHQSAVINTAIEVFGSADLLVNNAGINPVYGTMIELEFDAARKIFEVNCLAALSWARRAFHAWMSEHGGAVVNMASVGGTRPAPGIGFYGASKAMLIHMTRELALELGPNIRVNAVAPALVKTAFTRRLFENREEELAAVYPLKRLGVPDDVGGAVAFLLSDEAAWITGQILVIDGGLTLVSNG